jgi:hypothetical protein
MTLTANLPLESTTQLVTSFLRFTIDSGDTGVKFATGVNDTGGKLSPVSTTSLVICCQCQLVVYYDNNMKNLSSKQQFNSVLTLYGKPSFWTYSRSTTVLFETDVASWIAGIFLNFCTTVRNATN